MNDIEKIEQRFYKQLDTINADRYEIHLHKDNKKTVFVAWKNKQKLNYLTKNDIKDNIKALKSKNRDGYSITILPYAKFFYYIVINDVTIKGLSDMQCFKYRPCLRTVLNPSELPANQLQQVVLKIEKNSNPEDAFHVNFATNKMAKRFGTSPYLGVQSPIFAAGFKHKNEFVKIERAASRICEYLTESINNFRNTLLQQNYNAKAPVKTDAHTDESYQAEYENYLSKLYGDNVQWKTIIKNNEKISD
ncbi:hypothetical protein G7032_20045 [Pseudomonas monteilii]|uniref:hypothetical protein n=1 Tax=Pseudomonas TaxID=286 RepID=UPI0012962217|nr:MULTISPECIES: hypothetical protein [Pseudomonas]MBA1318144.1 hypothetical protein [Pseudomonas monteilii]MQT40046.1 hypothetical protein [Pseudomonas sp. FSL R10-0765]